MKFKAIALLTVLAALLSVAPPQSVIYAEEYDPRHTVLALDMAIVSIQRILNTSKQPHA